MDLSVFKPVELASMIEQGSSALFPTDTLPALASSPKYASQLWAIKKRSLKKPLILMASNADELLQFVSPEALEDAWLLARQYWPGAITLVLPASGIFVEKMNPGACTLGMRVPDSAFANSLLKITGPLATTSANISGEPPAKTLNEIVDYFPSIPLLGPLPWPNVSGEASTVVSWQRQSKWDIIREGSVIPKELSLE